MIQFNLLPDVKQQFIRAQRFKHTAIVISSTVTVIALGIFLLLLGYVKIVQTNSLNNLNDDISTATQQIGNIPNLNKVLTLQNQLKALPALNASKPVVSRLFTYLPAVTPSNISIQSITADFTENTIVVSGTTDSITSINTYVDTLKYATYKTTASSTQQPAFTDVIVTGFSPPSVSSTTATFSLKFSFDPILFKRDTTSTISVPQINANTSVLGQPLFQPNTTSKGGQ